MRITQMTSEQLIDSIIIWSAQEVQIVPTGNGRGRKKIQELNDKIERAKKELLRRLGEVNG